MTKLLASAFLMARFACQRLDVSWELCLQAWLSRPTIQIVLEDPARVRSRLIRRIDEVYPF